MAQKVGETGFEFSADLVARTPNSVGSKIIANGAPIHVEGRLSSAKPLAGISVHPIPLDNSS